MKTIKLTFMVMIDHHHPLFNSMRLLMNIKIHLSTQIPIIQVKCDYYN